MAANKQQGSSVAIFLIGLTTACAGLAYFSGGGGKSAFFVGAVLLAFSFWKFFSLKPLEGKVALKAQPPVLKLAGLAVNVAGWLVILLSIHLTPSVGGRMAGAILGIAISLVGVVAVLPAASNKNAIWKA